jgi:hypothetical protein
VQEFAHVGQYHGANCANCQRRDGRTKSCHQKRYILSRSRAFTDNTPPRFPSSKIEILQQRNERKDKKQKKTKQKKNGRDTLSSACSEEGETAVHTALGNTRSAQRSCPFQGTFLV